MANRKRVLFAIGSLGCGGSERQLIGILRHLDRSRFEPELYLLNRTGEFLEQVPDDVPVTAWSDEAKRNRVYFPGRIARQQSAHLERHLRGGRFDLLYERSFLLPLISAAATRRTGLPRVSTITADPESDLRNNLHRFRRLKTRMLKRAYREANRVLAVSEGIRQAAIDFYRLAPGRVATVLNGFDFERIDQLSHAAAPPMRDDRRHVVAIGRLQREKGCLLLLQAVQKLVREHGSAVMLWFVGDGPEAESLRDAVRNFGLQDFVTLTGFVENPYAILRGADLFCLPSHYEGMPNALVEAMACGVPVVATDCPHGPREILENGRLGRLVPPGDVDALAKAILESLCGDRDSDEQTEAARASVRERFAIEDMVRRLEGQLDQSAGAVE